MKTFRRALCLLFICALALGQANMRPALASYAILTVKMYVCIDRDGTANITEDWYVNISEGTEVYKSYGNLGRSEIKNFTVTDRSGAVYEFQDVWNTARSFEEKRRRNGMLVNAAGDTELCWGVSEYGFMDYRLTYQITNFVNQYDDAQGVYFELVPQPLNHSINGVHVTITSDIPFSQDTAKIWGFGYEGTVVFKDGAIAMDSGYGFPKDSYMVALIQFEEDYVRTGNRVYKSFQDEYKQAMKDAEPPRRSFEEWVSDTVAGELTVIAMLAVFLIGSGMLINRVTRRKKRDRHRDGTVCRSFFTDINFGAGGLKIPSERSADYWRDIPCNKDLSLAYWVAYYYRVSPEDTVKTGLMGAILLQWLKQGSIQLVPARKGIFRFRDNTYAVHFGGFMTTENEYEQRLLGMMRSAAGSRGELKPKQFGKWCKKNYVRVRVFFSETLSCADQWLLEQGWMTERTAEERIGLYSSRTYTKTIRDVDPGVKNEALKLQGLKRFLLEFSLIREKQAFEVRLWEDYLIFAQLLGIAKKVREQFSKVYPDAKLYAKLGTKTGAGVAVDFCASIASAGCSYAARGEQRAHRSSGGGSSGSSSGGGGSSHSGGGGGASGRSSSGSGVR